MGEKTPLEGWLRVWKDCHAHCRHAWTHSTLHALRLRFIDGKNWNHALKFQIRRLELLPVHRNHCDDQYLYIARFSHRGAPKTADQPREHQYNRYTYALGIPILGSTATHPCTVQRGDDPAEKALQIQEHDADLRSSKVYAYPGHRRR